MKTLHLSITVVLLLLSFNFLFAQALTISNQTTVSKQLDLKTEKNTYYKGDRILILGHDNPNTNIQISLIGPDGIIVKTVKALTDKVGIVSSFELSIPENGNYGVWKIYATDDIANASSYVTVNPLLSPLKQFKSGILDQDVICLQDLQLVIKSEDGSPACVKPQTAQKLVEREWGKSTIQTNTTNQRTSAKESIRIITEQGQSNGIYKNGFVDATSTIEIIFDNFKQTASPLIIQIFNPHGGIYKVDNIPSSNIQPDGFYKYQIYIKGNESAMGEYSVVITHNNETASTSAYLTNVVP